MTTQTEIKLRKMIREEISKKKQFERLTEINYDEFVVKKIPTPNKDYISQDIAIERHWREKGKFRIKFSGGRAVSILDFNTNDMMFDTAEQAEKFAKQVIKDWVGLLTKYKVS